MPRNGNSDLHRDASADEVANRRSTEVIDERLLPAASHAFAESFHRRNWKPPDLAAIVLPRLWKISGDLIPALVV
jgi:hypothetical protein